jgi:hypothetical protein
MFRLQRIFKNYAETGSFNELVNLYGFVDSGVFLTKTGDFGVVLEVRGVDYECLDGNTLDGLTKRLESALKLFDENYRIYQYLFKRNNERITYKLYDRPFSKALYFLDGKLADGMLDAYRKDDIIKKFLTNTSAPEIDIEVKKVALEDMQSPPFKARVDFYMVYYSPADRSEIKRDLYTANFVFVFKSKVPNELIPINPLGVAITYFREDQAFK